MLRVVRRHPHNPPVLADDIGHIANRLRVDAANRRIKRQPSEYFNALRPVLAHEVREASDLGPVIL
jgi:hypothetical protein